MNRKYITMAEALVKSDADTTWRLFQLGYPEDSQGRFRIERFKIGRLDEGRIRTIRKEGLDRDPGWGSFTKLVERVPGAGEEGDDKNVVWMSDTKAEILEHSPFFNQLPLVGMFGTIPLRILVNGLGLGMVVNGALKVANIKHIDVVESNPDVARLVRRHLPDDKVTVHIGDAFDVRWPRGTKWDMVWHDIWPTIDNDNLPQMDALMRQYRRRTAWQDCWQRDGCLRMADAIKRMRNKTMPIEEALEIMAGRWPV